LDLRRIPRSILRGEKAKKKKKECYVLTGQSLPHRGEKKGMRRFAKGGGRSRKAGRRKESVTSLVVEDPGDSPIPEGREGKKSTVLGARGKKGQVVLQGGHARGEKGSPIAILSKGGRKGRSCRSRKKRRG